MWVSQAVAHLNLTPVLQDALRDGGINVEDARQVARLPQGPAGRRRSRPQGTPRKPMLAQEHPGRRRRDPRLTSSGNAVNTPGTAGPSAGSTSVPKDPVPPRPPAPAPEASQGVNAASTLVLERRRPAALALPQEPSQAQNRPAESAASGNGVLHQEAGPA